MKQKLLKVFLVCTLLVGVVYAQNRQVSGKVTSALDGSPVQGVSVAAQGTSTATQTDGSGNYSINVAGNATLVFTYVGYQRQTVAVGNRSTINVQLTSDETSLEEVVVTGYGVRQIKDLTGSQGSVKGEKLAAEPILSFEQAMSGKLAGVQIGSTGGTLGDGVSVRIRGVNSISASSLPLYVIDGVPMNTVENVNTFNSGDGTRFNPLAMINSNDIESIEVLKDAGAAVLYGSRAANGVIIITTKRGKKGVSNVSFESKFTSSKASKLVELLNGDQFIEISNEKARNAAPRFGGVVTEIAKESDIDGDGVNDRTNWLDEVYRTGYGYDNSLSISSGSEKGNFFASARYLDQKGIILQNQLKMGQVRMNGDINPTKWMKTGISVSYSKTANDGILTDRYIAGATVAALNAFPTVAVYNKNQIDGYNLGSNGYLGAGNNITSLQSTNLSGNIANPLATLNLQKNQNTPEQLLANGYIEIQPLPGLRATSKFGIDYLNNYEHQYSHPKIGGLGTAYGGLIQDNFRNRNQWVWQNYINYDKTFAGVHRFSATVGTEYQYTKEKQVYAGASNISDPFFTDIIDGTFTSTAPGSEDVLGLTGGTVFSNGLQSYFSRLGYVYDNKYLVDLAFRADAFSAFGVNSKWGYFPSASLGWVASEEEFLKDTDWLSYLKLRMSYGKVGNSRGIASYASRTLYTGGSYATQNGFSAYQLGNPDLQWETSNKYNVGVDFNILNNRFNFVIDYFYNNISGLVLQAKPLYTVGVPSATPSEAGAIFTNIGSMSNKGLEFTVNVETMKRGDFTWNTSLNFTTIKNEVKELVTGNVDIIEGNSVASVGRSLGTYKLTRWAGVDPNTGNPMFLSADGTKKIYVPETRTWRLEDGTATSAISGNDAVYTDKSGLPKYYGGLDNNFTYKKFDLGISIVYTGGFYIYNTTRSGLLTNSFLNNSTEILDRWTTVGQQTDVPRVFLSDPAANQASTRFLEKGDFLRFRTISLGYNFGGETLSRIGINNLRVFAQVYNPFIITGYSGQDPEVNTNRNNSNIAIGVDNRAVPQPRTYTFGLNVSL
ncbi:SusC/RagA family TonB-linked outer membrane protein [Sphingobacterium spiritivorum]|nr:MULTISPECIES: TonB-dependent receptor [unclassified Sphingobacterium]